MTLLLNVPFDEKNEVKDMGAGWNPTIKKWYVQDKKEYYKFVKWFSGDSHLDLIICDHLYILEGSHTCFKCKKKTTVIGFGIENYIMFELEDLFEENSLDEDMLEAEGIVEHHDGEINIASQIEPLPIKLMEFIQGKYNYKLTHSKFAGSTYLANRCDHCDTLQGNHFLFSEVDSPFFLQNEEDVSKLKFYKVDLLYDLPVSASVGWSSTDYLIKEHGRFHSINLDL